MPVLGLRLRPARSVFQLEEGPPLPGFRHPWLSSGEAFVSRSTSRTLEMAAAGCLSWNGAAQSASSRTERRWQRHFWTFEGLITTSGPEQGLLGLAFHPNFANNGQFFIYYTATDKANTVARYTMSADPNVADPNSGSILFALPDTRDNHNGGMLAFGPDGYLYIGTGDGGAARRPGS